jgi:hypothetical protein
VVDETVIEIFTAKMGITSSGFNLKNTFFGGTSKVLPRSKMGTFRSPTTFLSSP